MPTYASSARFRRDIAKLTRAQRQQFYAALALFVADLREIESGNRHWFRKGIVSKLHGVDGLFEFRWADDGRATFSLGNPPRQGLRHIEWHRCGTHDILP